MAVTEPGFGKQVGGSLCLDFMNTVAGRVSGEVARRGRGAAVADAVIGERLVSFDALLRWAALARVVTVREAKRLTREASARPAAADAVLRRAVVVREAMYRVFKAALGHGSAAAEDLDLLNRELRVARAHERLAGAGRRLEWAWDDAGAAIDRALWPVVKSAAQLLTSSKIARVRQCPGEQCGWLFLDTSRSGRRRWCDMADCGNLAKVRRFRQKRRQRQRSAAGNSRSSRKNADRSDRFRSPDLR